MSVVVTTAVSELSRSIVTVKTDGCTIFKSLSTFPAWHAVLDRAEENVSVDYVFSLKS